jgi:integrase
MKAGKEHCEPLSDAAVSLLKAQPRIEGSDFVFTSPRGGELSDMTLSKLMKGMGYKARDGRVCVPHGLRSTFRDWAAERTNYPREVVEAALAHTNADKTEAAYLRTNLLAKRAKLMAEWSKFLAKVEAKGDNVIELKTA